MEDIIKAILINTISATKISNIIKDHSDSNILTGDHIICGLVYRLMNPMTQDEINNSLNDYNNLLDDNSSDEYSDDENDESIENIEITKELRKIKPNNCNCDICIQTRVSLLNFNDYEPIDQIGYKFKSSIIETCNKYNRYI